mmetsp:Transcript_7655/g.11244  ORF Transcript_7655/g.11244 Transcript_7655/m.11244 type:complete len:394 (-) Transcript_7655:831-2012(-)
MRLAGAAALLAFRRSPHNVPTNFRYRISSFQRSSRQFSSRPKHRTILGATSLKMKPPSLIDVDCNLLHPALLALVSEDNIDPLAILKHKSTIDAGIVGVLSPSSTLEESQRSVALVSSSNSTTNTGTCTPENSSGADCDTPIEIRTTVGIHPYHTHELKCTAENISRLSCLIVGGGSNVACVGECGLDYSEGFPEKDIQIPWLHAQLDLAFELQKPLFFHERLAFHDFMTALEDARKRNDGCAFPPAIVHCFTGTKDECRAYLQHGFYIGITGFLNKQVDGAREIQEILSDGIIPLDRLMIETDAPYLGFEGCRDSYFEAEGEAFSSLSSKKRKKLLKTTYPNVPSSLPLVLRAVTEHLNKGRTNRGESMLSEDDVATASFNNAVRFFGFKVI